jgi:hypothetical protein
MTDTFQTEAAAVRSSLRTALDAALRLDAAALALGTAKVDLPPEVITDLFEAVALVDRLSKLLGDSAAHLGYIDTKGFRAQHAAQDEGTRKGGQ